MAIDPKKSKSILSRLANTINHLNPSGGPGKKGPNKEILERRKKWIEEEMKKQDAWTPPPGYEPKEHWGHGHGPHHDNPGHGHSGDHDNHHDPDDWTY